METAKSMIPQKRTAHPALKYLYKYVKADIAIDWFEIGVELLDAGDEAVLNVIKKNYPGDANKCASEMLQLWLARKPEASWNQLLETLREPGIKLNALATKIEEMLSKDFESGESLDRKRRHNDIATSDPEEPLTKRTNTKDGVDANDLSDSRGETVDFSEFENDVFSAFTELFNIFQIEACKATYVKHFPDIKRLCMVKANASFVPHVQQVQSMESLLDLLAGSKLHCNWIKIGFLEAIASRSKMLKNVLKKYEAVFFPKKLSEIWEYLPCKLIRNKYYEKLKIIFNDKDPDNTTLTEVKKYCRSSLATDLDDFIIEFSHNCLSITWLVPTDKIYHHFLSVLTVPQESRKENFLQIGTWVVHHPQSVLQKLKAEFAMASPLTLLIGYYYGVLLRDTNADSLLDDKSSECLLSVADQSLISAGHSVHYRNWLLFEHIRHMDTKLFLVFCELVQNILPSVGSQLITASNTIPEIQDNTTDFTEAQTTTDELHGQVSYFKPSSVHIAFLYLIDQLQEILQHSDYKTLVAQCENIMACMCDQEDIKLFSTVQIEKLKQYNATLMLLWSLSCFFTWSNHSILRMLLTESSSKALQLLDEFDSRLDPLQSIASYPIPYFSSDMIPDDTSTYTILAIRCDQVLYKSSLQYVYNMQSVMMEKCHITQHCLQLLAVRSDPTILFWTIPKLVVNLISKQVPRHSDYLYSKGVLEVLVYPEPLLSTGDDVSIGSLAFKVAIDEEHDDIEQTITLPENIESHKANEIVLEKHFEEVNVKLQMKEANLQIVTKSNKQLQEKMTQIKLKNIHLNQQIEQLSSKLLEMKKKNQLNRQLNSVLLKKLTKQSEQLNLKPLEITEKKDELNIENLKTNSELRENNSKESKVQDVKDSQDDLTELKDMGHDRSVIEQETPAVNSKMVTPSSAKLEMELTRKKKHTVHCFLHHFEVKCNLCETAEDCQDSYDKEFASRFEEFLGKDLDPTASLASEDTPDDNFLAYIEVHLQAMNCPSLCSRLWRYCFGNKLFGFFKYAPEGLLIHSNSRENLVGTIIETYSGYRNVRLIGYGTFGSVYKYTDQTAVKEEFKRPLITGSTVLFQRIVELNHPHVIKVLEYIVGPYHKDGNKCFLSVMSYKNQKDLYKQFKKENLTCVLDYMTMYRSQEKFIFRNYTVLFRHVFEGLCYLKSKGIVHRDIKSSNILVHQNCVCPSPLQCTCTGDGDVTYLLGDMGLLSLEEESANSTYTCDEWKKMVCHDPAGTIGMKPPESFFRNEKGEHVTTHKSDVWSVCVTMMNVLIGKAVNNEAQEEISKFITAVTEGTKTATKSVTDSSNLLQSIMTMFKSVLDQMKNEQTNIYSGLVNNEMSDLDTKLNSLKQLLGSGERSLYRSQSFHGEEFSEIYKEKNPLAGILTTAYGAQVLHWKCLNKVQHIYNTQLWTVMQPTMDVIVAGIKFVPERRPDATELVDILKTIPPVLVDYSNNDQTTNN